MSKNEMKFLTDTLKKSYDDHKTSIIGYKHYICYFNNYYQYCDGGAKMYRLWWMYDTITEHLQQKPLMYV